MVFPESPDLNDRVSRLELLVAALVATPGGGSSSAYYELLELLLDRNRNPNTDQFIRYLDRAQRRSVNREFDRQSEIGELRSELARLSDKVNTLSEALAEASERSASDLDLLKRSTGQLRVDAHSWFAAQSLGTDIELSHLPRFIPVQVYLSEGSPETVEAIKAALGDVLTSIGLEISDVIQEQKGSWYKRFLTRTKDLKDEPQIKEALQKFARAVELNKLSRAQAEIDGIQSEAVAKLLAATANEENVAMLVGSILFVKRTKRGKTNTSVKTLTNGEMIFLDKHRDALLSPDTIIERLKDAPVSEIDVYMDSLKALASSATPPQPNIALPPPKS